jgi:hypothetical protein
VGMQHNVGEHSRRPAGDGAGKRLPVGRQAGRRPPRPGNRAWSSPSWPLHVLEDAGHFMVAEPPDALLEALRAAPGNR